VADIGSDLTPPASNGRMLDIVAADTDHAPAGG